MNDNEINQMLISKLLEQRKIDFDIAQNGAKAIYEYMKHQKDDELKSYDLILMDVSMPKMGGVDATKHIIEFEEQHNISHTPIVALTANALTSDKQKYLDAGMDDYLAKPIDNKLLGQILLKYLGTDEKSINSVVKNIEKDEKIVDKISTIVYDKENISSEMGVPKEFLEELLSMFFDDIDEKLANLKYAIIKNDLQTISDISHALKGLTGNIRFEKIFTITSEAEVKARDKVEYDYDKYLDDLTSLVNQYKNATKDK